MKERKMAKRMQDPTIEIVTRAIKSVFFDYGLSITVRPRRKDHGYNIDITYSLKEGLPPLKKETVYEALAERLVVLKAGQEAKLTLEEVKERFCVKSIFGVGRAWVVGEETVIKPEEGAAS
jgi:hypothetical protein